MKKNRYYYLNLRGFVFCNLNKMNGRNVSVQQRIEENRKFMDCPVYYKEGG